MRYDGKMSLRPLLLLRPPPPPQCARTGVFMADIKNDRCPFTLQRVEDMLCPILIGEAPQPMELDALLRLRKNECEKAAAHGRAVVVHVNPTNRMPYAPRDVRLVRYDGMPVDDYNENVRHLNRTLRVHLPPYVGLAARDAAHLLAYQRAHGRPSAHVSSIAELAEDTAQMRLQHEGKGRTLADTAARPHPATQRAMAAAAAAGLIDPTAVAAHVEATEAARRRERFDTLLELRMGNAHPGEDAGMRNVIEAAADSVVRRNVHPFAVMEPLMERIADHRRAQRAARRQHFEQTMARLAGEIEGLPSMQARVDRNLAIEAARIAVDYEGLDPSAAEAHVAATEAARRAYRAESARFDQQWQAAGAVAIRSRSRSRSRPPFDSPSRSPTPP
jgi:hypothetical protein